MTEPGSKQSLETIWNRGCRGDDLNNTEKKKFAAMARSRFHTFLMGVEHAERNTDEDAANGLVRGMAVEIRENPGLRAAWMRMSVVETDAGKRVNLQIERLESPLH